MDKISIELTKLQATIKPFTRQDGSYVDCLVIPVDQHGIRRKEQRVFLNAVAFEQKTPRYGNTHMIKPDLLKAEREALTQEQQKTIPIIGNARIGRDAPNQQNMDKTENNYKNNDETEDDLPF